MKRFAKIVFSISLYVLAAGAVAYAEDEAVTDTWTLPAASVTTEPMAAETADFALVAAPSVIEKTTLDNLQSAFNGESNAHAKYLEYAKKADSEGYGKVASLFRVAARAERIHFTRHAEIIKKMGGEPAAKIELPKIGTTAENLQDAIKGETYETSVMYPEFLKKAEADKNEDAIDAFEDAGKAEGVHAKLYQSALDNLRSMKGKEKNFYVCPVCGNVEEQLNFKECPVCGTGKQKFLMVR